MTNTEFCHQGSVLFLWIQTRDDLIHKTHHPENKRKLPLENKTLLDASRDTGIGTHTNTDRSLGWCNTWFSTVSCLCSVSILQPSLPLPLDPPPPVRPGRVGLCSAPLVWCCLGNRPTTPLQAECRLTETRVRGWMSTDWDPSQRLNVDWLRPESETECRLTETRVRGWLTETRVRGWLTETRVRGWMSTDWDPSQRLTDWDPSQRLNVDWLRPESEAECRLTETRVRGWMSTDWDPSQRLNVDWLRPESETECRLTETRVRGWLTETRVRGRMSTDWDPSQRLTDWDPSQRLNVDWLRPESETECRLTETRVRGWLTETRVRDWISTDWDPSQRLNVNWLRDPSQRRHSVADLTLKMAALRTQFVIWSHGYWITTWGYICHE